MMNQNQTIIIKKIKKGGHGAHGGAWKVAYADFVTAMMAFFLLMWLLAVSSEESLNGIADYFTPTMGLTGSVGSGLDGGKGNGDEGHNWDSPSSPGEGIILGAPPTGAAVVMPEEGEESEEEENFSWIEQELHEAVLDSPDLRKMQQQVMIDQTPEGLRIQLLDDDKTPMFKPGKAELQPGAKKLLASISNIIGFLPNYISISGHTNTTPGHDLKAYGDWELSSDRALATRRFLIKSKLDKDQVVRIVGKADVEPLDPKHPEAARNRRISIILLRKVVLPNHKKSAPDRMLSTNTKKVETPAPSVEAPEPHIVETPAANHIGGVETTH